jgi:hypothetical protein
MFIGLFQLTVYVSTFVGPLVGTALSGFIGIGGALVVAGAICFMGFGLFAYLGRKA